MKKNSLDKVLNVLKCGNYLTRFLVFIEIVVVYLLSITL